MSNPEINEESKEAINKGGKWTVEELEKSLKINIKDYGSAIGVSALFKKLYGRLPEIQLSGAQAEMAESICDQLPEGVHAEG